MPIYLMNISQDTDLVQVEVTYQAHVSTTDALARILTVFADHDRHPISIAATDREAIITFHWDGVEWDQLFHQAVDNDITYIRSQQRKLAMAMNASPGNIQY
ncbi:uncharacterized protein I206_100328 [Kwoniella pini CBS 10737]|uniref:Uncharacterized protein n=1 Tax=Kwoniella pini CBS 10737 TaxID=1296096 RepID=A0A1B9IE35_9TREE|nr:uncharacterized protein I206_00997 [Kwoniella pini CBS 10737]OCF53691.1 hypothetical protein I206_00997 [Kwoniella pini CBS 10737]